MKKEVIIVPKDKCPLDVLAEMGNQTRDAWIFLHCNVLEKLRHSKGVCIREGVPGTDVLTWAATEEYPETTVIVDIKSLNAVWKPITAICASDIAFTVMPVDFEDIFFLKMEE